MCTKIALALLSAFLMLQCTSTLDVNTGNTCDQESTISKNPSEQSSCSATTNKVTFRSAMLEKLTTLADAPLKSAKILLEKVNTDVANLEFDEGADKEFLKRFLKGYAVIDEQPTQKAHLFLTLCYLFDFFKGPVTDVWKKTDIIYKELFEQHDFQSVAMEFVDSYEEFLKWLLPEITKYWDTLNEADQLEIEKFKLSCKEFQKEVPFLRKLQCFMRMFEYFAK